MESFTTPPPPPPPPRTIKDLPADFMISVVERLSIVDRVRFGSSCSSFNSIFRAQLHLSSCTTSIKTRGPPPWMLLPGESTPAAIAFFSISDSRIYRIPQKDSDSDSDSCRRCRLFLGSSDGWLVTLDQGGYSQLYLLNPITGTKIHLPPLPSSKLISLEYSKAILSWTSSSSYTVVLLLAPHSSSSSSTMPTALVCTTEEEEGLKAWTPFGRREWYSDAAISRGGNSCRRLYTMRSNGTVEAWDLLLARGRRPSLSTTIVMPKSVSTGFASFTKYLVKSKDGHGHGHGLLQVWRSREFAKVEFKVFKLEEEEWVEVKSLDGQVIFLNSHCASMSMDCPPELIRGNNSIYFDCLGATSPKNRESMVFRMEDGSVESILLHGSIWEPSPIWIVPTLLGTDC